MERINKNIEFHFGKNSEIQQTTCQVQQVRQVFVIRYHLSCNDCFFDLAQQNYWIEFRIHPSYFDKYDENFIVESHFTELCLLTQTRLYDLITCTLSGIQRKLFLESTILFLIYQLHKSKDRTILGCKKCKVVSYSLEQERIEKAKSFILSHLSENLSISGISSAVGTNDCYLKRGFKEHTGQTLFEFIQEQRMMQGQMLLQSTKKSIREVAHEVGYSSLSSFSQAFKNYFGFSPKQCAKISFSDN